MAEKKGDVGGWSKEQEIKEDYLKELKGNQIATCLSLMTLDLN